MVDRLEELFQHGARVPFSNRVMLQEQAFHDIIDEMRIKIPEEVREAKRIVEDRDRILAQARDEAQRTRESAQEQMALLLSREGRVQVADAQAAKIIADAQREAEGIRAEAKTDAERFTAGANEYVMSVLTELDRELNAILTTTRNGIHLLQTKTAARKQE